MDDTLKSNLTSGKHWLRLVFMLLFACILYVAMVVMWALVALQFLFSLITGRDNRELRRFGETLSLFILQALRFLTYNSEDKPFPFSDWPQSEVPSISSESVSAESENVDSENVDSESAAETAGKPVSSAGVKTGKSEMSVGGAQASAGEDAHKRAPDPSRGEGAEGGDGDTPKRSE